MELITREICLTSDVGTKDILFGGRMLAWADIAASIWCRKLVKSDNLVTVHMSDIDFLAPVRVGDLVEFYGEGYRIGRSSVSVKLRVMIHDPRIDRTSEALRFSAIMVNIDADLRPKPLPEDVQNIESNWSEGES